MESSLEAAKEVQRLSFQLGKAYIDICRIMTPDRTVSIWNRGPDCLDTVKGLELAKQDDVSLLDHNNAAQRYKGQNAPSSPRIAKKQSPRIAKKQRHITDSPTQKQFRNHQKKGKDSKKKHVTKKKEPCKPSCLVQAYQQVMSPYPATLWMQSLPQRCLTSTQDNFYWMMCCVPRKTQQVSHSIVARHQ
jgi:hypothetical protein